MNKCYLAGGCFWCIGDYLSSFNGVSKVTAGYSGGEEKEIDYLSVKHQLSEHRETVEVNYDNNIISLEEIIGHYLEYVDPYDKDGQYIDRGHSYTLALFYQNKIEENIYKNKVKTLEKASNREVFISIEPFKFFVEAEDVHQNYAQKHPQEFYQELVSSNRVCHLKKYQNKD